MKRFIALLLIIVLMLSTAACSKNETANKGSLNNQTETADENPANTENEAANEITSVKFCYQDGTPALTAAKLAKESPNIDGVKIQYDMTNAPDVLTTKVLKEEADIAIVPSNLAAQAYNKGLNYKIVGTAVWGSFYLVGTEEINDFSELKGKEIYTFGKGLTPDIVFRLVLSKNGIDPDKDVTLNYLNAATEVAPVFISGKAKLAVFAEPMLTTVQMKKQDAKVLFDINEEWGKATGTKMGYPQASLIVKGDLIENNRDFVEKFIEAYKESRTWAKENPEELGKYAEEVGISVAKETIEKGIRWNSVESFDVKDTIDEYEAYFKAILDYDSDFIGGEIPDENIYYKE